MQNAEKIRHLKSGFRNEVSGPDAENGRSDMSDRIRISNLKLRSQTLRTVFQLRCSNSKKSRGFSCCES